MIDEDRARRLAELVRRSGWMDPEPTPSVRWTFSSDAVTLAVPGSNLEWSAATMSDALTKGETWLRKYSAERVASARKKLAAEEQQARDVEKALVLL